MDTQFLGEDIPDVDFSVLYHRFMLALQRSRKVFLAKARTLRARADECRTLAESVTDPDARSSYVKLADSYDLLADQEQQLAMMLR